LPGLEDDIDKMAYTLANPVAAGLVRRGDEWPGVRSSVDAIGGGAIRVRRPEHFFRADGPMPETASLRIVAPPGVESLEGFRSQVKSAVVEQEEQAARKVAAKGRGFIGVRRVLAQSPFSRPTGNEVHRELSPRVAGRDRWKRIEAIGRLKEFLRDHREAWREFASGVRDVVFPHGTYWMRVMYAVPCASAG
jgi:putative transposase